MNTNKDALEQVMKKLNDNFTMANDENIHKTNDFLYHIELIEDIYNSISESKSKEVFEEARTDLLNSLIFCFQGYYRQANICLRSSMELVLSFLYYYDNQYDFILWKNDCIDMTWSQLINVEKGVFNDKFLSIINGKAITTTCCLDMIKNLYHLTSQYVHGKYDFMQKSLSDKIEYSSNLTEKFFETSKKVLKIEIVMLYIRFKKEVEENLDHEKISCIKLLEREYGVIRCE